MSEDTAKLIDSEIRDIVMRNYRRAKDILEDKRDRLIAMADALLDRETLDADDVRTIMGNGTLPPTGQKHMPSSGLTFDYLSV
jgi:cell division protease FtsH